MKNISYSFMLAVIILSVVFVGCENGTPNSPETVSAAEQTEVTLLAKRGDPSPYPSVNSSSGGDYTLWSGKHTDAGTVSISNDAANIIVTVATNGTADLDELHAYVWTASDIIPAKRPAPGRAPYKADQIGNDTYDLVIPLKGFECGDMLYISVHAALTNGESAYAGGYDPYPKGKGAWWGYVTYMISCGPQGYSISGYVTYDGDCDYGVRIFITDEDGFFIPSIVITAEQLSDGIEQYTFTGLLSSGYFLTAISEDVSVPPLTHFVSVGPSQEDVNFAFGCPPPPPPPPPGDDF